MFFKKALHEAKASGQHLSFKVFDGRRPGHAIKTNSIKFETVDPGIYSKHDLIF